MAKTFWKFLSAAVVLAAVGFGLATGPAQASLGIACPGATAQPFLPWADGSAYAFAPDGGFEAGGAGWQLAGGAAVTSANETFSVHGSDDSKSLMLSAGSSAATPPMCIGVLSSHMRFFVRNGGSPSSRLRVQVVYDGGLGAVLGVLDSGTISAGSGWQPSGSVLMTGGLLPLLTQAVQFRFVPADSSGAWQIDDVYVDPMMHG
jgi:hypothetical protein